MRIPSSHRADSIVRFPSCGFHHVDSIIVDYIVAFYPAQGDRDCNADCGKTCTYFPQQLQTKGWATLTIKNVAPGARTRSVICPSHCDHCIITLASSLSHRNPLIVTIAS